MSESETNATHWSQLEEKGSYLGMRVLFGIYSLLGSAIVIPILYPVVFYFFLFGKLARKSSMIYLDRVFNFNREEKTRVTRWHSFRHFMAFAQSILDKIGGWAGKVTYDQVRFDTRPRLLNAVRSGKGGVIVGAHLGSLEVGRALSKEMQGLKLNVLVHTSHAEQFNRVLRKINPESQAELLQVTTMGPDTAIMLREKIDRGEFIAILGDRTPVASQGRDVWLPFLGKPAPFPQGPYILAGVLGCPLYMLTCLRAGKRFDVFFDTLADRVTLPRKHRQQAINTCAQLYVERLEHYVTQYPYQWFNFFDFWHEFNDQNRKTNG
ncbi:MAG: glycosyl transferase [Ketobacteraceae bacterium]|nr:glycosyl transferase [Ketobacteraceae bacterium]